MASGQTHAAITTVAAVVSSLVILPFDRELAYLVGTGCLSGLLLTPDLDQIGISYSEWKIIRFTAGLGYIWLAFWGPYATLIPHRSPFSHAPIVGTIFRLLYIYGAIYLLIYFEVLHNFGLPPIPLLIQNEALQSWITGLILSDVLHWAADQKLKRFQDLWNSLPISFGRQSSQPVQTTRGVRQVPNQPQAAIARGIEQVVQTPPQYQGMTQQEMQRQELQRQLSQYAQQIPLGPPQGPPQRPPKNKQGRQQ